MSRTLDRLIALLADLEAKNGAPPTTVALTHYTRESFAQQRPGESYDDWTRDQADVICHLKGLGIKVTEKAPARSAKTPEQRAASAAREYRLGLSMGAQPKTGKAAIGWMVVNVGKDGDGGEKI